MNNFKISIICIMFLLSGCLTTKDIIPVPADIEVPAVGAGVTESAKIINNETALLRADATATGVLAKEIEKKTKNDEIKDHAVEIKGRSDNQLKSIETVQDALKELSKLNYQILTINRYLQEVKTQNSNLKHENKEYRSEVTKMKEQLESMTLQAQKGFKTMWMIVGFVCVVILGVGIYLMVSQNAPKIGMAMVGSALMLISISYFMAQYPVVVAVFGGVIFVGFLISLVYQLFVHKKVIEETTDTVELLKENNWSDIKDAIKKNHSSNTKKIVNLIKTKKAL